MNPKKFAAATAVSFLLVVLVPEAATAEKSGSKTSSGTAAYLLDEASTTACNDKAGTAVSPLVLSTKTVPYGRAAQAWLKSADRLGAVSWSSSYQGRPLGQGSATVVATCGSFVRVALSAASNGDGSSGYFYGVITVKFFSTDGAVTKAIGNDSITFEPSA